MSTVFEKAAVPVKHPLGHPDPNREAIDRAFELQNVLLAGKKLDVSLANAITGFDVVQSTRTSSYVEVTVRDNDRTLLTSKLLASKPELVVDGRSFTYVRMDINDDRSLVLTFEATLVNKLRKRKRPRSAVRSKQTRARFIGVGVTPLGGYVCPEIDQRFSPAKSSQKAGEVKASREREAGLPDPGTKAAKKITVKHAQASPSQLRAIQAVLEVGVSLKVSDTLMLAAIMAATQESTFDVDATNDSDHVGLFQMSGPGSGPGLNKGTVKQRKDPVYAARWFYANAALKALDPYMNSWEIAWRVEAPSNNPRDVALYGQWFEEAKNTLAAFKGGTAFTFAETSAQDAIDTKVVSTTYLFSVGPPAKGAPVGESEWDADRRMADEVNWYLWENSNFVYFMSGRYLLTSKPRIVLHPNDDAIVSLSGSVDEADRANDLTFVVRANRWSIPQGVVALLDEDWGSTLSGRWLVAEVRWSLFSNNTTLELETIKTPKQEPNSTDQQLDTTADTTSATAISATGKDLRSLVLGDKHIDLKSYAISNYTDVQGGIIIEDVMRCMLAITEAGFDIFITALKSNHGNDGPNGHAGGKAMDIGRVNGVTTRITAASTSDLMVWLKANQAQLGWRQMFGPIAALNYVSPTQAYGSVYPGHDNHIHVGF